MRWDGDAWAAYGPVPVVWDYEARTTNYLSDGTVWFLDGLAMFDGDQLLPLELPIRGRLHSTPRARR